MQSLLILLPVLALAAAAPLSQDSRPNVVNDGVTIDSAIAALYDVISGPPGPRDWDRFKGLFAEDARLAATGMTRAGERRMRTMTPDGYIEGSGAFLEENGFFEIEIARTVDHFGDIAHAFSTYEARREKDGEVIMRGINSIQLVHTDEGWRILTVFWTQERDDQPIPEEYLP